MTQRHPSTRARDRDRDAAIEVIEAAYGDGQLSDADREIRVGNALRASTLSELQVLTADLQGAPDAAVPLTKAAPTRRAGGVDQPGGSVRNRVVAGLATLLLILGIGVTGLAIALGGGDEDADPTSVREAPAAPQVADPVEEVEEEQGEPFDQSLPAIETFVDRYEEQFATTDAYYIGIFDTFVSITVPSRGSKPRWEDWYYRDGIFERGPRGVTAVDSGRVPFDLRDIDYAAMLRTVETGRRVFDVPDAPWRAVTSDLIGGAQLLVYTVNEYSEGGYIATTYAGKEIRRVPFN